MQREKILIVALFIFITSFFFYPVFKGLTPFPGDLLVGETPPYSSNTYHGYAPGGVPNKAQGPDVIRQLFPWKHFTIDSYKQFQLPFWNPYNFSGNPHMANFQSGVFYPFNAIFLVLDFINAWTLYIFFIPLLAAVFTYFFLRELSLEKIPSFFGGIVFAFSSYMVVWMEYGNVGHTFLWLPLILLLTEKLIKKFRLIYYLSLIGVLSISLLGGYIQGYFYILVTTVIYFFGRCILSHTLFRRRIFLFAVALVFPIFLTLFQLLPTIELFHLSARGNYSLEQIDKLLNPFWYLITIIVPNFFGNPATRNYWIDGTYIERVSYFGLVPFIFSLYALINFRRRKEIIIFLVLFVFSLLLATNLFITKYFYLIPLPTISTTVPTRILSLFVFSGSILAAFGFDLFLKRYNKKSLYISSFIVAFLIFASWLFVFITPKLIDHPSLSANVSIVKRNLLPPTFFMISFITAIVMCFRIDDKRRELYLQKLIAGGLVALTTIDLFFFFHKITPFSPREYMYPSTDVFSYFKMRGGLNRFWGYGSAAIDTNMQTYEKIYSPDGYDPLHIKRYGELLSSSKDGTLAGHISGADANIKGGYGTTDLRENIYRQKILNLLGVKYVLHKIDPKVKNSTPDYQTFPENIYTLRWQKNGWQIYENNDALPRTFLTSAYTVETDRQKILAKIFDKTTNLEKKVVLEEMLPPDVKLTGDPSATVSVQTYMPNEVVLQIHSSSYQLLFLSDNYFPGWKVSIDGENDKIYRANYSFRAVLVKPGSHSVRFWYYPASFDLGLKITFLSVLCLIFFGFLIQTKKIHV